MSPCDQCHKPPSLARTLLNPYNTWPCPACGAAFRFDRVAVGLCQLPGFIVYALLLATRGPANWAWALPLYVMGGLLTYRFAPRREALTA